MRAIVRYITFACSSYHVVRTNFKDHWRFLNADVPCTLCPHTDLELYGVHVHTKPHTEKVRCVRIDSLSVFTGWPPVQIKIQKQSELDNVTQVKLATCC